MNWEEKMTRNREIMELADRGVTPAIMAGMYRMSFEGITAIIRNRGRVAGERGEKNRVRSIMVRRMRKEGMTLQAIGEHLGITRERVRQIIAGPTRPRRERSIRATGQRAHQ